MSKPYLYRKQKHVRFGIFLDRLLGTCVTCPFRHYHPIAITAQPSARRVRGDANSQRYRRTGTKFGAGVFALDREKAGGDEGLPGAIVTAFSVEKYARPARVLAFCVS